MYYITYSLQVYDTCVHVCKYKYIHMIHTDISSYRGYILGLHIRPVLTPYPPCPRRHVVSLHDGQFDIDDTEKCNRRATEKHHQSFPFGDGVHWTNLTGKGLMSF